MEINYIKTLIEKVPRFIKKASILNKNNVIVEVDNKELILLIKFFKLHTFSQFFLMDITSVDYPQNSKRFIIVYQLLSFIFNYRITLKVDCNALETIPSLMKIYKSANWLEREVWDLFGIYFSNHIDLRRILTDYGFQGFPFRKDFPLSGFLELIYSDEEKRVNYIPLELTQEYRFFDFITSWQ